MKRLIALTLALVLLLSLASCGAKPEETTPAETIPAATEPTAPVTEATESPALNEPEWEPGIARAGYGEAVYTTFAAYEAVNVIGQFKDYYVVEGEELNLLVEQRFIRLDSEEAFVFWEGYTKAGTEVFDNVYMRGEPVAALAGNTKVTVLEGKGDWACIEWEEGRGYVSADMLSKWRTGGSSGGSSSGGSGGSTKKPVDGTDVPIGSLTSAKDEFQAELHLLGDYYGPEMEKAFENGMAKILAQDVEGYLCLLRYGDEVKVTAHDEQTVSIWLGQQLYATLPRWLVKLEGDAQYEPWTGYSRWSGIVYEEYQMRNEILKLSTNDQVIVLDELEDCYVVEYEGQIGYMVPDKLSTTKISGSSGSGSSGGSGGSGGGSGGSGSTWTPPKR